MEKLKRYITTREAAFLQDGGGFLIAVMLLVIILALVLQVNSLIRISEETRRQLEKGATIAIKGSILDEWRMDYIARIDTDAAETIFNDFIRENMHMDIGGPDTYERHDDSGNLIFSFHLDSVTYDEGGSLTNREGVPKIEATGVLYIPVAIFTQYTFDPFEIPFTVVASNRRIVYEGEF